MWFTTRVSRTNNLRTPVIVPQVPKPLIIVTCSRRDYTAAFSVLHGFKDPASRPLTSHLLAGQIKSLTTRKVDRAALPFNSSGYHTQNIALRCLRPVVSASRRFATSRRFTRRAMVVAGPKNAIVWFRKVSTANIIKYPWLYPQVAHLTTVRHRLSSCLQKPSYLFCNH